MEVVEINRDVEIHDDDAVATATAATKTEGLAPPEKASLSKEDEVVTLKPTTDMELLEHRARAHICYGPPERIMEDADINSRDVKIHEDEEVVRNLDDGEIVIGGTLREDIESRVFEPLDLIMVYGPPDEPRRAQGGGLLAKICSCCPWSSKGEVDDYGPTMMSHGKTTSCLRGRQCFRSRNSPCDEEHGEKMSSGYKSFLTKNPPERIRSSTWKADYPEIQQITTSFIDMLSASDAKALMTWLADGRSEPREISRGKTLVVLSDFLSTLEEQKEEYIQQARLIGDCVGFQGNEVESIRKLDTTVLPLLGKALLPNGRKMLDVHGPQLFAGPSNLRTSLHFDRFKLGDDCTTFETDPGRHNIFLQLTGRKLWLFFPPVVDEYEERERFYPLSLKSHLHVSEIRTMAVEAVGNPTLEGALFKRFPGFEKVYRNRIEIVLEEGDAVHIPPRWWHTTKSLSAGIAINWWFSLSGTLTQEVVDESKQ